MQEEISQTFSMPTVANIEFDTLPEMFPVSTGPKMFVFTLESPVFHQAAETTQPSPATGSLRPSLGDPSRNEAPKLPVNEITRDLHCEMPQNYNNVGSASSGDRLSFGSDKGVAEIVDRPALTLEDVLMGKPETDLLFQEEESDEMRTSTGPAFSPDLVRESSLAGADNTNEAFPNLPLSCSPVPPELQTQVTLQLKQKKRPCIGKSHSHVRKCSKSSAQGTEKKCCNCARSGCLKLYCECFAAGQYCEGCSCEGCRNTEGHEKERTAALGKIAKKNPSGYARRVAACNKWSAHKRQTSGTGCNCAKSGCRKGYCECFKSGAICGPSCSCVGCRNVKRKARRNKKRSLNNGSVKPATGK